MQLSRASGLRRWARVRTATRCCTSRSASTALRETRCRSYRVALSRTSLARRLLAMRASSRYRSVVALCTSVCLTSAPNVCRRLATHRRVTGRRRGGGGGFEETARRRTKAKQQEYFGGARLFLGHVTTSWSNELQSLASSPGDPAGSHFKNKAATARRASLTRTLYVRQAAPVFITSQPMPRPRIAASSRGSGNLCRGPAPRQPI